MINKLFAYNPHNPDVLSCLANLSNDEVFTPPVVANELLDLLPQEIFSDPTIRFLDPACKTGVMLREIAKRLINGLERVYPDIQTRVDHILREQLFGIAITELTSHLSRRSIYCSKTANGNYSITHFGTVYGNIRYKIIKHDWDKKGKCRYCDASKSMFDRPDVLESHAYEFIHTKTAEEIFNMKFDVIISNPPYQLNDGGNGDSASPIYHKFIEQAKRLEPRYLTMIVPSRYFTEGKGLSEFRKEMINDRRISKIVDFINAKDCFPYNSVSGGVNYFLWERDYDGECEYTTVLLDRRDTEKRSLNDFPILIRHNKGVEIVHKVLTGDFVPLSSIITSRNPFGLETKERGGDKSAKRTIRLISSKNIGYISPDAITEGEEYIDCFKVMFSRTIHEHAFEYDNEGRFRILSRVEVLEPNDVCTDSYLIIGKFKTRKEAENLVAYLKTKFARFLVLMTLSSINLPKDRFRFTPMIDFSKPVDQNSLYKKYGFSKDNINYIESLISDLD